jgi:mannosyltransferase
MSTSGVPALRFGPEPPRGLDRLRALVPASAETWALAGLILVAVVIRIVLIDNQSLWSDEALTAHEAQLPFGDMLHIVSTVETTPPLYFVLTWLWAKVFGTSAVALRAVSAIAGVALVPLAFGAARRLFSGGAGVVAAAIVAVNPFLIWYSQEARSYMLLAALSAAGFLCFVHALERPSRRWLVAWALLNALALMTHFFAGFIVAPEVAWLLWRHRRRAVLLAIAAVAVVQAAMLPFAVSDTGHGTGWIASVPRLHRIATMTLDWGGSLLSRKGTLGIGLGAWAMVLAMVVALVVLSGDRRTWRGAWIAGSIAAFVILVPIGAAVLGQDYFLSRNVIPAFVPLAVLIAGGFAAPRVWPVGAGLAVVLIGGFAAATAWVQTHPALQRPDWRAVAQALGPAPRTRAILATGGTTADALKIYLPGVSWVQPQGHRVLIDEIDVVGAQKKMALAQRPGLASDVTNPIPALAPARVGRPVPVLRAPAGTRRISRFPVRNWVIGRYRLRHPRRLDVYQLVAMAHRFFRHTPATLLVFIQEPRR